MWNVVGGVCGQWYHSESGSYICVCVGGGGEVHWVQPEVVKPMPRALAQALQWGCNVSASDSELQVE